MQNFVYQNPTKVLFGKEVIENIGSEARPYGSHILLVTGLNSLKKSGYHDLITRSLQDSGCTVTEFPGILPNPTVEQVRAGIEVVRNSKIEVICAAGGGSTIDAAKAIGAGAVVAHDVWKFFTGKKGVKSTLPVVAVPTLAASGSEMNSGMVLTNNLKRLKFGFANRLLFPKVALIDPQTTFSVSAAHTAYGAIDTLAHLFEVYFTNKQTGALVPLFFIQGLARTVIDNVENALVNPEDYEARANLMWASSLALNGLMVSGLGKVGFPMHLIEHSLSSLYGIPHGAGLAVIIPGWLRHQSSKLADRIQEFFSGVAPDKIYSPQGPDATIDRLSQWFSTLGAPVTLEEVNISPENIGSIADNTQPLAAVWRMREYDTETVENILRQCV